MTFTKKELEAIQFLRSKGGSILTSQLEEKSTRCVIFGDLEPGLDVFRKLDKKGVVIITEEEPDEDGFTWTPSIEFTESGELMTEQNL